MKNARIVDFEVYGELIERRTAAAEVAAARERAALETAQQLFDIHACQRAGACIQYGGAIEPMGNGQNRVTGALEIDRQSAAAFDPVQPEHLTETIIQIDVGELHMGGRQRHRRCWRARAFPWPRRRRPAIRRR